MSLLSPRFIRVAVVALTVVGLGMAAFTWVQGVDRIGRPWVGFGVLPNGDVGPPLFFPAKIRNTEGGPRFQERIVGVNGTPVDGARQIDEQLQGIPAGTTVRYSLETSEGIRREIQVEAAPFDTVDWQALFLPLILGGIVGLLIGAVPVLARPDLLAAQVFFLTNLGLSMNFGFATFDYFVAHELTPWTAACGTLASGSLMLLGFVFPSRIGPARNHAALTAGVVYGVNAAY